MYQTVNADAVEPMNGLRLSGPAVQPSRRMTLPLLGEGLTFEASADVMPHKKPTESSSVATARPTRQKDGRARVIKGPPCSTSDREPTPATFRTTCPTVPGHGPILYASSRPASKPPMSLRRQGPSYMLAKG